MEESRQIKNKKITLSIIGVAILVVGLVGITFAFFNYTRTGTSNTIKTGRIAFTTSQGTPINLTNMFPIEPTQANLADNTKVGTVTIDVSGDTTYGEGIEYLVTATNVSNTVGTGANAKTVPISIQVTYSAKENKVIGTPSNSYFADRGSTTSYYKVLSTDTISDGDRLLVGYIKPDNTGIDGTITIKAYLDSSKVAISDTYPEETIHTVKGAGYSSSDCETVLTGVQNASTYCATASSLQSAIDNGNLTSAQITLLVNANIVEEYTNGTTSNWVNNRVVLTTNEWNSLQQNGVSFQVKVEANEGVWVKEQIKYNANGGTVSPAYKEIDDDATVYGTLAVPTAPTGYEFDGWYTDPVNGTEVTASTSYTQGTSATTLYAHWSEIVPICIRATTLHTETCNESSGDFECRGDGYYSGGAMDTTTITYGNLGTSGELHTGDAFDCDVDGTGYNQRFYYVSPYYNTDSLTFDDTTGYATLIYYSNTVSGAANASGTPYATLADLQTAYPSETFTTYDNWHGPVTAKANLPTTSQWSNITLKTSSRAILAEYESTHNATSTSGGTLPTAFSYSGYAARLLTAQEIMRGCGLTQIGNGSTGEISTSCKFLMEETSYGGNISNLWGIWVETPPATTTQAIFVVYTSNRKMSWTDTNQQSMGVRPAIDVPYSKLSY